MCTDRRWLGKKAVRMLAVISSSIGYSPHFSIHTCIDKTVLVDEPIAVLIIV